MSELSEIREMIGEVTKKISTMDSKIDSHIAKTEAYREEKDKKTEEHHKTLYATETGVVYGLDRLKEAAKTSARNQKMMATIYGIPICGGLIEALVRHFK